MVGAVASWLVCSTSERAVRVRALAGDIVLCSWARHFTLTVPLSTQVYKWVPASLMLGGNLRWTSIPFRGEVEILLVASCYGNQDKLRPGGPHWPVCRLYLFTFYFLNNKGPGWQVKLQINGCREKPGPPFWTPLWTRQFFL